MLARCLTAATAAVLLATPGLAQNSVISAAEIAERQAFEDALALGDFTIQGLEILQLAPDRLTTQVEIGGQTATLNLYPWSIRSADHFEVLAQVEDGSYVEVDVGPSQIWHGSLAEFPEARISASWDGQTLDAMIKIGDDQLWGVQSARQISDAYGAQDYVVYTSADNLTTDAKCGGALVDPRNQGVTPPPSDPNGFSGASDDEICEIACDADVEFYNKNGSSVANTEADIENIIDRVMNIYQADVSILYEITTIIVRTSEPDPYSSTSASTLLNQFQSHWNSSQGGVQRDVAHLFTGKNIQGGTIGIAYLNVICNLGSAYGLSESRFTNNITSRTALTAHELGHNWASNHCNGTSNCKIMCASLGGCGSLTSFGPFAISAISNKKNSVNCLDDAVPPPPPVINSISPSSVSALGGQITLTGLNMAEVFEVVVGGQTLSGTQVIPLNDSTLNVFVPQASSLGTVSVTAANESGSSNAVNLTFTVVDPPVLNQPSLINTFADSQAVWTFGTTPGDICFFLVDLDNTTFQYQGYSVLDTLIPMITVPAGPAGVGAVVVPIDPSMGGVGLYTVFSQMAFVGPPLRFISAVKSTSVF